MNHKRTIAVIAGLLLVAMLLPPISMLLLQQWMPAAFGDSYYAALQDKYDALCAADSLPGRRILLIGGSGTAFSVDGALLEEETGIPCVNFALYAAFGSEYMMELAKNHIRKGDIVILCPELSKQTLSMYFGADAALQASEGDLSLLFGARTGDWLSIFAEFPGYFQKKLNFLLAEEDAALPDGVYARTSFDEKGNMTFPREENRMLYGYLPDALPVVTPDAYAEDFLDYLCRYADFAVSKGAEIYYAFPFMNRLSLAAVSEGEIASLERFLMERLNFPLLSALSTRILPEGYFYDSNYHTTTDGTTAATLRLAEDIKRLSGDTTPLKKKAPPPLDLETATGGDVEEFTDDIYRYRLLGGSAILTGISEDGKAASSIELPDSLGGYPLTGIAKEAFKDCAAARITIPEGVTALEGALFRNCENLTEVHLRQTSLPAVGETLLDGFDGDLRIYVPAALYGDYVTDYFWLMYSKYITEE